MKSSHGRRGWWLGPAKVLWLVAAVLCAAGCEDLRGDVLWYQAQETLVEGNTRDAVTYLRRLVTDYPNHPRGPEAALRLAHIFHYDLKRPEAAEVAYRDMIEAYPRNEMTPGAIIELADLQLEANHRPTDAMVYLQMFLQRFPGHPKAPETALKLADLFMQTSQLPQAIIEYEAFQKRYPNDELLPTALLRLAEVHYFLGDAKQARKIIAAMDQSKLLDGQLRSRAEFLKALTFEENQQLEEALKTLKLIRYTYPNTDVVESRIALLEKRIKNEPAHEQVGDIRWGDPHER